jgi:hypothetical protein
VLLVGLFLYFLFVCFAEVGLELREYSLSETTSPFCEGFLRIWPHKPFAWADFKA